MNRYDLILFDFDGTLMNTEEGIKDSATYALKKYDLGEYTFKELDKFIGPPFNESLEMFYPELPEDKIWEITNDFRNHYRTQNLLKASFYDGLLETVKEIREKGIKTGIATYKREDYAATMSEAFHLTEIMDCVEGCDFFGKLTKTDIVKKCMEDVNITDPKKVLMVGDGMTDAIGARENGVDFVAALYGFGLKTEEEQKASDAIGFIYSPEELLQYL